MLSSMIKAMAPASTVPPDEPSSIVGACLRTFTGAAKHREIRKRARQRARKAKVTRSRVREVYDDLWVSDFSAHPCCASRIVEVAPVNRARVTAGPTWMGKQ